MNTHDTEAPDTTMTFKEFFEAQNELMLRMGWPGGVDQEGFRNHILAATSELVEALHETNWKPWKPNYLEPLAPGQRENLKTELTDIMQFIINAALCMGYTAEDLSDGLRSKLRVNHERVDNGETTNGA